MHVLLVYCHPEPQSFTHALLDQACRTLAAQGHSYEVSDLYGEEFNPVAGRHDFTEVARADYFHYQTEQQQAASNQSFSPEILREQARVRRAHAMVFLFPLWWGGLPAMLKGWFDRVLAYGFAYVDGARYESGLLRGRGAIMCVTTGGTAERFSVGGSYGSIEQVLWPTVHCQLRYLGLDVADPFVAYAAPRVGDEGRRALLEAWQDRLGDWITERAASPPELTDLAAPQAATSWASQA